MLIRIIEPDSGDELPIGSVGEIAVKGVTLMRGYYKVAPEEYLDTNGFFRTKDAGWIDERGYLHWTGRLSGLIKTGGANVSPVEVEAALAKWGVFQTALVVGVPHPTLGEVVVACAVPKGHTPPPTEDEVRQYLRTRLASYKVPRRVLLFDKETLSFTGNDKIQLAPLRALAVERLRAESTQDQRRDAIVWP
jgi:acyl-CoA synthetase (AMP-forming)/AMP-acid ligase II